MTMPAPALTFGAGPSISTALADSAARMAAEVSVGTASSSNAAMAAACGAAGEGRDPRAARIYVVGGGNVGFADDQAAARADQNIAWRDGRAILVIEHLSRAVRAEPLHAVIAGRGGEAGAARRVAVGGVGGRDANGAGS